MRFAGVCAILICALQAAAQEGDFGGYGTMTIKRVGNMHGSFANGVQISEMTGGVEVVLKSAKAGEQDLPISANSMTFQYPEGGAKPSLIVLQGKVRIQHPKADVSADRAEWDFNANKLVFTGNPVMRNPQVQEMRCERMTLDFATNDFNTENCTIAGIDMTQGRGGESAGGAGGGGALSDAAVTDWQGLIQALKDQSAADAPSPGKHIVSLVDPSLRNPLQTMAADQLVAQKAVLLKQLNALMRKPSFFNVESWAGVTVPEEVLAQARRTDLTAEERGQVNHALLHAAFPSAVAAP